ncbi:hypothetical protein C7M84_007087 [Penaeus vannamei]|uniref:Uncharacterized protein n=1 Tax=Penaeus vannamei TaxID=6689 RepID=A0A423TDD2_PENVA|nr:hypothetical protein C7M84_007087 [Penaeus vannamei]
MSSVFFLLPLSPIFSLSFLSFSSSLFFLSPPPLCSTPSELPPSLPLTPSFFPSSFSSSFPLPPSSLSHSLLPSPSLLSSPFLLFLPFSPFLREVPPSLSLPPVLSLSPFFSSFSPSLLFFSCLSPSSLLILSLFFSLPPLSAFFRVPSLPASSFRPSFRSSSSLPLRCFPLSFPLPPSFGSDLPRYSLVLNPHSSRPLPVLHPSIPLPSSVSHPLHLLLPSSVLIPHPSSFSGSHPFNPLLSASCSIPPIPLTSLEFLSSLPLPPSALSVPPCPSPSLGGLSSSSPSSVKPRLLRFFIPPLPLSRPSFSHPIHPSPFPRVNPVHSSLPSFSFPSIASSSLCFSSPPSPRPLPPFSHPSIPLPPSFSSLHPSPSLVLIPPSLSLPTCLHPSILFSSRESAFVRPILFPSVVSHPSNARPSCHECLIPPSLCPPPRSQSLHPSSLPQFSFRPSPSSPLPSFSSSSLSALLRSIPPIPLLLRFLHPSSLLSVSFPSPLNSATLYSTSLSIVGRRRCQT